MADQLTYHPIASIFPLLDIEKITQMAEDIREHGLRNPICVFEGKVLDGRNRAAACAVAGVTPKTYEFEGTNLDAVAFVWSENYHRRHLDSGGSAIALAKRRKFDAEFAEVEKKLRAEAAERKSQAAGKKRGEKKTSHSQKIGHEKDPHENRTDTALAKTAGTNRRYLEMAEELETKAPELADKVHKGQVKIGTAYQELKRNQQRKELKKKAEKFSQENASEQLWDIRRGDCLEELAKIPNGGVRLAFADPPYNIGIDYGDGAKEDLLPAEEYIAWVDEWILECKRVLSKDGSLWVMIGDEYAAHYYLSLCKCGFTVRSWIKWHETFGVNCANNFNRCSRHIFYAVCDTKHFVFNADAVTRPSDRQAKYSDKRAAEGGKIWDNVWGINPPIPRLTGTCKERIPDFPTQYPLAIAEAIVGCASEPGDTVLDPFSGSATTGVAAVKLGRRYIGIELRKRFAELSITRLKGIDK